MVKFTDDFYLQGRLWEIAKRQARQQNQLPKLERYLAKKSDVVAQIRAWVLRFELEEINFSAFAAQLKAFSHPLADSYIVQIGALHGDSLHHHQTVHYYLSQESQELDPQNTNLSRAVLFKHSPPTEPCHLEAAVRLQFGLGISLICLEQLGRGKHLLEKAKHAADRLGIPIMALDAELSIAIAALSEGDHLRANQLLLEFGKFGDISQMITQEDNAVTQLVLAEALVGSAALHGIHSPVGSQPRSGPLPERILAWLGELNHSLTFPRGLALLPWASDAVRYPGIESVLRFFRLEQTFLISLRGLHLPQLQEAAQKLLDLDLPAKKNSLAFELCFWIKQNALIHTGHASFALELLRENPISGAVNNDFCRTLRFATALQCQFFLGDGFTVREVGEHLEAALRYLEGQSLHRDRVLDFICQGAPNIALFLHHLGCTIPELNSYLERCVWVKRDGAYLEGVRIPEYPLIAGHSFPEIFELHSGDPTVDYDKKLIKRTQRHRKTLEHYLEIKTSPKANSSAVVRGKLSKNDPYPAQVSDVLVQNTLAHLISQNAIPDSIKPIK
jgi:hypothetical protein